MLPKKQFLKKIFLSVISCFILASVCACLQDSKDKDRKLLMDTINLLWKAKIEKDWGTVYDMNTPKLHEKTVRESFVQNTNLVVTSYEIINVDIIQPNKKAIAKVKYSFEFRGNEFKDKIAEEEWLFMDSDWRIDLGDS